MQVSSRRYSQPIRALALLLGFGLLWSGSNILGDIVDGFARERGFIGVYVAIVLSSVLGGVLLGYVGLRGRVPGWLAALDEHSPFDSRDAAG